MTVRLAIIARKDLNMRKGKLMAQAGHASVYAIFGDQPLTGIDHYSDGSVVSVAMTQDTLDWIATGQGKLGFQTPNDETLEEIIQQAKAADIPYHVVIDSGLTEFSGVPTRTCIALGPANQEVLKPITQHLQLY